MKCKLEADRPASLGERREFRDTRGCQRVLYRVQGPSTWQDHRVHSSSLDNLERGLLERVFYLNIKGDTPPSPLPGALSYLQYYARLVSKRFFCLRWNAATFVSQYVGRKRTVYAGAAADLEVVPLSRRDAQVSTFVKCEKLNLSKKRNPVPRVIQPRDPRFNLEIGCYLASLEKHIYTVMASMVKSNLPVVAKGMNADEQGVLMYDKWSSFTDPVAVGLDASRFDQHVSVPHLKYLDGIYLSYFGGQEVSYLRWLLECRHVNRGRGMCKEGVIKYSVEGRRMSGDMDTSMGNCILMCAMTQAMCQHLTIPYDYINNGDDLVIFTERQYLGVLTRTIPQWYLDLGFTIVMEPPVRVLEQVEFCQTRPLCVDGQWRLMRTPSTCLSKDLHSIVPIRCEKDFSSWCNDISTCGLALNAGVPVLQEFYRAIRRGSKCKYSNKSRFHPAYEGNGMWHLVKGLKHRPVEVADSTRYSFWLATGILPDEQIALEEVFRSWELSYGKILNAYVDETYAPLFSATPLG